MSIHKDKVSCIWFKDYSPLPEKLTTYLY